MYGNQTLFHWLEIPSTSIPAIIKSRVHLVTFDSPSDIDYHSHGHQAGDKKAEDKSIVLENENQIHFFSGILLFDLNIDLSDPSSSKKFLHYLSSFSKHSLRLCCMPNSLLKTGAEKKRNKICFLFSKACSSKGKADRNEIILIAWDKGWEVRCRMH